MRRPTYLLCATSLTMLLAMVAGNANAAYWEVVYDLEGSILTTYPPVGPVDEDPIAGQVTVRYEPASGPAYTSALIISGYTHSDTYQPITGLLVMTGSIHTELLPQTGGVPGTLNTPNLDWAVVADCNTTGYLHCTDVAAGMCTLAGMTQSVSLPMTPFTTNGAPLHPNPFTFPTWIFSSGNVGAGAWTSPTATQTVQTGAFTVNLEYDYVGREISRTYVPEPSGLLLLASGAGLLLLLGCVRRR